MCRFTTILKYTILMKIVWRWVSLLRARQPNPHMTTKRVVISGNHEVISPIAMKSLAYSAKDRSDRSLDASTIRMMRKWQSSWSGTDRSIQNKHKSRSKF